MSADGIPIAGIAASSRISASTGDVVEPTSMCRQPARTSGTWRVGKLSPRTVKVVTAVGFLIPLLGYVVLLRHYQVNAILADQWDQVPIIQQSFLHFPNWSSLWTQHNGNRLFFPNLIAVGLAHSVHFNIDVEEDLGALMLLTATALFIWSHKRRSPDTPLLFYCPVAFLTLSFAQWQNTLWGFQMAWYLVLLSLALTIMILDRPSLTWPILLVAVLVAAVGSYSSVQGLLIWPVGVVLLYHRRRPLRVFVCWMGAAVATAILYFHNLVSLGVDSQPRHVLENPLLTVKFFMFALGDVVGLQMKLGAPGNPAVMVFGVITFALAVFVLLKWGIRRDEEGGAPIGIALIVFGLLFDAIVTEGRILFGLWGATQSRYTTNDVLVLTGVYMTVLSGMRSDLRTRRQVKKWENGNQFRGAMVWAGDRIERIDRRTIQRLALMAIALQLAFSVHFGLEGAREIHQEALTSASLSHNFNHESNATIQRLYYTRSPGWIRTQLEFLEQHHLTTFG